MPCSLDTGKGSTVGRHSSKAVWRHSPHAATVSCIAPDHHIAVEPPHGVRTGGATHLYDVIVGPDGGGNEGTKGLVTPATHTPIITQSDKRGGTCQRGIGTTAYDVGRVERQLVISGTYLQWQMWLNVPPLTGGRPLGIGGVLPLCQHWLAADRVKRLQITR
ncbi:hypothetical protein D3C78_720390 [compost metagenome]